MKTTSLIMMALIATLGLIPPGFAGSLRFL